MSGPSVRDPSSGPSAWDPITGPPERDAITGPPVRESGTSSRDASPAASPAARRRGRRRRLRLLVWKEFLQVRRDPMFLRMLFAMPVVQLIMFGYLLGTDVTHVPTAIVDLDRTAVSRQIDATFAGSSYFDIRARPAGEGELRPLLDRGQVGVAIVVPAGTQAALDRGETAPVGVVVDGSDSQWASAGTSYATRILAQLNADRLGAQSGAAARAAPGLDARIRVVYNQSLRTVNAMIPGLIAVITMISILAIMGQAVVKERERGTLEQMFVTPISRTEYLVGKVIPYVALASAQSVLVGVLGTAWFGVPFAGSLLVVVTGMALFMLTNVGLGLLISLVSRTRQQAQQTMVFVTLPTMILSGFIFPVESMAEAVQPLARAIPATYILEILRAAFIKGSGFAELAVPFLALAGFGVAIFGAAVLLMHRRLSE